MFTNKEGLVSALSDEFIGEISTSLRDQGVDISPLIAKLVINQYLQSKRDALLEFNKFCEPEIGTTYSLTRGLREGLSDIGYTVLLRYDMDQDLKNTLIEKYSEDDELNE